MSEKSERSCYMNPLKSVETNPINRMLRKKIIPKNQEINTQESL